MRILLSAAVTIASLWLAACSTSEPTGETIAIITPGLDNPMYKVEADAATVKAVELGYGIRVRSHGDDVQKEAELIDTAILDGAAAIILDNAGAETSVPAIQKAKNAGVPVFLIGHEISATGIAAAQIVPDSDQCAALGSPVFVEGAAGVVDSIRSGEVASAVLWPASRIAQMAVEQADRYLRAGKTGQPEKQSVDCILVTRKNVDTFDRKK